MKIENFQIPAAITKISTLSGGLRLQIDTQELPDMSQTQNLWNNYNKLGWFVFNVSEINEETLINLPELKYAKEEKSPSQRLYNVLYVLWEKDNHGKDNFKDFYEWYMESLIEKIKEKLS